MLTATRALVCSSSLTLVIAAIACGGSPTRPSDTSGATIAGTVHVNNGAAVKNIHAFSGARVSGLTVSIAGTTLATAVEASGYFQLAGVPAGNVRLQFSGPVTATADLANVRSEELVELQIELSGSTATVVSDVRSTAKVSLCHRTESGSYHMIDVSESAEPAHRAHGDGRPGENVPGATTLQTFDQSCRVVGPAVQITKSTNGEDANNAPGPTLVVGSTVTWQYVVTNTGTVALTNVVVVDDRGVSVSCPGTTLAVGQSMTCTGSGVATLGQYRNVGTVTANSASGSVTDSDPSHYLGRAPEDDDEDGPKVQLCHRTGNGSYHSIEVSVSAEPAHRAHGDGKIGELVPDGSGRSFGPNCQVR